MAEPSNSAPQKGRGKQWELTQEARLILAFILMGLVLFLTPLFYKPPQPHEQKTSQKSAPSAKTSKPPQTPQNVQPLQSAPGAGGQVAPRDAAPAQQTRKAEREEIFVIENAVYKVTFSNRGAVVRSWLLKHYRGNDGNLVDLVNPLGAAKTGYPLSLLFDQAKPATDLNKALFACSAEEKLRLVCEYAEATVSARKTFRFKPGDYVLELETEVSESGRHIPHRLAWRGGFGDRTVSGFASKIHSVFYDLQAGKLVTRDVKSASGGPVLDQSDFTFAGIQDVYFAAVFLPADGTRLQLQTWSDSVRHAAEGKEEPLLGIAAGGEGVNRLALFAGPKDLDVLKSVNPKLTQIVDWGWFAIIARPLFLSLKWVNDHLVHNYGWSIVLITVVINFLLLPLKFSSMRSMKKMQDLAPLVAKINEKYKGVGIRDPKKAKQNEELMALYKEHNVNPVGGCLPMLLQMPFFFAFYKVLSVAIELRGAGWLWVQDLSQPEHLPIHVLPVLMVITQVGMSKITPTSPTADPAQQRMMTIMMPLMLGIFLYSAQSGLVLYWLTGNVVAILQQLMFNRLYHSPKPATGAVKAAKQTRART